MARSTGTVPRSPQLAWAKQLEESISANVIMDGEGRLYFTTTKWLYAFDANGEQRWKRDTNMGYVGIAIAPSNDIIDVETDGRVVAISPDNVYQWSRSIHAATPPTIGRTGRIYACGSTGAAMVLDALSPSGDVVFEVPIGDAARVPTLVSEADDGSVYVALADANGGSVVHVSESGAILWSRLIGTLPSDVAIAADGSLRIVASSHLLALSVGGSTTFDALVPDLHATASIALDLDGRTLVGQTGVVTYDASGIMTSSLSRNVVSVAFSADGTAISVTNDPNGAWLIGSNGNTVAWSVQLTNRPSHTGRLIIGPDGTVYVVSAMSGYNGLLFAIR